MIGRNPRPDLQQALDDVYLYQDKKDEAQRWYALALAGYLKSVDAGNLHYAHHLAGFYCDAQANPVEALKWAKKDLELRQNCYAYDLLAWALYKNADFGNAAKAMTQALAIDPMFQKFHAHR